MDEWDRKWIGGLQRLATALAGVEEGDGTVLDRTSIVYGGGHGRRPHFSHDLPCLLMGGSDFGFKHGGHLAFQPLPDESEGDFQSGTNNTQNGKEFAQSRANSPQTPLANAFVSIAKAMGVPTDSFADSTGPLNGLV